MILLHPPCCSERLFRLCSCVRRSRSVPRRCAPELRGIRRSCSPPNHFLLAPHSRTSELLQDRADHQWRRSRARPEERHGGAGAGGRPGGGSAHRVAGVQLSPRRCSVQAHHVAQASRCRGAACRCGCSCLMCRSPATRRSASLRRLGRLPQGAVKQGHEDFAWDGGCTGIYVFRGLFIHACTCIGEAQTEAGSEALS